MDYSKTPHVCFKVEQVSFGRPEDDLPRILEHHLRAKFDSVRVTKTWFLARWAVVLQAGQKAFTVGLTKSKYEEGEWVLLVGPLEAPAPDRVSGASQISGASELMLICREIHNLLAATSGITAIRWYFEGRHSQSAAVTTPDELPWA